LALNAESNFLRAFVIMLHPLRQSRTRHTLTDWSQIRGPVQRPAC
jgi:hypothetical protein